MGKCKIMPRAMEILESENLPVHFTSAEFHSVAFKLFGYAQTTTRKMLSNLKKTGVIEVFRRKSLSGGLAKYRETRTKESGGV